MHALLDWLNSPALVAFEVPTTWAEVLGFASGALCVWFVARQNVWNWPLGIANNLLWILLFASAGLFADSGLQVVYVVLAVWGWNQWLRGGAGRTELEVTRTSGRQWIALALAGVLGVVGLDLFLEHLTSSTVPLADAVTTTLSLLATWGQCRKKVESWWLWIAADVVYVPLYQHKGLTLTAVLYVGFLALCVKGLLEWRRDLAPRRVAVAA
ncbi:nicotinamide riboside transporter PnuC [Kineococcus rhizosphaerae]|uniref:Nicotinamide mononucleotide transporter n=1 Tax=Kineococcus rhizosphaerae TaxID=559628 RepID=A0A2T0R8V2_9ACTN|nr:nicotinamide riboside transporter PnuC [Kineococcus rhizosphaerae]PRY17560.1 nicotinamide mononucleotide transporter [Kineococcus rhizosphaerae]